MAAGKPLRHRRFGPDMLAAGLTAALGDVESRHPATRNVQQKGPSLPVREPPDGPRDLHWVFWLGLPLASLAICWLSPLLGTRRYDAWMMGERGFWEHATVVLLVAALGLCVMVLCRPGCLPRWMRLYLVLVAVVTLYFAGEELSWGQHWFGFATPPAVAEVNTQREFNLHNLPGAYRTFLNALPKRLAIWTILAGGVILPLAWLRWGRRAGRWRAIGDWLVPTWRVAPVALLYSLATVPEHVLKGWLPHLRRYPSVDMALVTPAEEFKEYLLAMTILLYVLSLFLRSRRVGRPVWG